MKLRSAAVLLGLLLVAAPTLVLGAPPPIQVKPAAVPKANGTKGCTEARGDLVKLNRLAAQLNKRLAAEAAKKKPAKNVLTDLEQDARRLQKTIALAASQAKAECKQKAASAAKKPTKPKPAGNQGGALTASTATPPEDNGTDACQAVIDRIGSLNAELLKAVKSYNFTVKLKPSASEAVNRARKTSLEQLERRIADLETQLSGAVEQGKTECAKLTFAGSWSGTYSGADTAGGCTIPSSGGASGTIEQTADGRINGTMTFTGGWVMFEGAPSCTVISREDWRISFTGTIAGTRAAIDYTHVNDPSLGSFSGILRLSGTTIKGELVDATFEVTRS